MRWIWLRHVVFHEVRDRRRFVLPFLGLAMVVALAAFIAMRDRPFQVIEDEHHHFWVNVKFNGAIEKSCMVDSGSSDFEIPKSLATQLGIHGLKWKRPKSTANGLVLDAPTQIDRLEIGPFTYTHFAVAVAGGAMDGCLIGASWLSLVHYQVKNGVLTVTPKGA